MEFIKKFEKKAGVMKALADQCEFGFTTESCWEGTPSQETHRLPVEFLAHCREIEPQGAMGKQTLSQQPKESGCA